MKLLSALLLLVLITTNVCADSAIFSLQIDKKSQQVYPALLKSLQAHRLVVVSEINILEKFKQVGLPKMFGKEFNTNNLTAIRAVIACNGYFGNYIANADSEMLALCPVRITLYEKAGKTTILFIHPTPLAKGSAAYTLAKQLDEKVVAAIKAVK